MGSFGMQTSTGDEGYLPPWERIAWKPEQEQVIYRDWGTFFTLQQHLDIAAHYYDKSLSLRADDANSLYFRSVCRRKIAQITLALQDAMRAAELKSNQPRNNMAIADALYELNAFETSKMELHDSTRKYFGSVVNEFLNRIVVVDENLNDSLGDSLALFFLKSAAHIEDVADRMKKSKIIDNRPLWKKLKDEGKCDIMSIPEKEEERLSPRELARRVRSYRIFNQIYLERGWVDAVFMRTLRDNNNWLPPHYLESTPFLRNLVTSKYSLVKKFLEMLHARSPLYQEYVRKFPNTKLFEQHRQTYLNCVQYRTHRNMRIVLRRVKELRKSGKTEELAKYIEEVMGRYVVLKTFRNMTWKFEFINEIYNTLALAFADSYKYDEAYMQRQNGSSQLHVLLRLPIESKDKAVHFEFGNKSTSLGANDYDHKYEAYKRYIGRLERRMIFTKYPIERCYLWHEISRAHFKQARFDECYQTAKRSIEESKFCNNRLWAFLSTMIIVKAHASLRKIERCKDALDEAFMYAAQLMSDQLVTFVDAARLINDEFIEMKKKSRSTETIRRRRSSSINLNFNEDEKLSKTSDGDDIDQQSDGV